MAQRALVTPGVALPAAADRRMGYLWRRFRRNRLALVALAYLVVLHLVAAAAPALAPHPPEAIDLLNQFGPRSPQHPLGTDETGRDVLSRLIFGARTSLVVGLAAMAVAMTIGSVLGAVSGFYGGLVDTVVMRIADGTLTIPTFFLALLVLAVFGSNIINVVLTIGGLGWMVVARVVRAEVLRTLPQEFVAAARALGASDARLLGRHLLPQALPSMIVAATLGVAYAILTESALSYLGLGVQPPMPTWGNMLTGAQHYVWTTPVLAVYPGAMIMLTVLSYNTVGDALRDTLDPRHAGT
ncbi:MAG: ABC transporter permease [Armatimonadota bacterium]|nr:ABC transporter permease [Armatimonadota bacterium]MDR7485080.1 ABC transporter permease [Armatimonadota bacterium]MDR7537031.1 ABC transporter permease [Armatimonadota bacterium]